MAASHMRREIEEIPLAVERLLSGQGAAISEAATAFVDLDPLLVATVARGSSDHAAHFLKYAYELTLGLPGASLGPSLRHAIRQPSMSVTKPCGSGMAGLSGMG